MLVDMTKVKFKELSEAIKILNESKLLKENIPTTGITKDAMTKAFVVAVQSIPDDENENWSGPAAVANYYNSIIAVETPKEEKPPEPPPKPTKPTKEKPKTESKKEPEKPEKKDPLTRVDSIYRVIVESKGVVVIKTLGYEANKIYAAAGKKDNEGESKFVASYVINTLVDFGLGTVRDGTLTVKL